MKRESCKMVRCTVERLMKKIDLRGAVRGKIVETTAPDTSVPWLGDRLNRSFLDPAPNLLWVSDFT